MDYEVDRLMRDCFAYWEDSNGGRHKRCQALHKLYCEHEDCKFYKAKEQYERETKKEKI